LTRADTPLRLSLPATSANLGPGFDAAAVAVDLHLRVTAAPSREWRLRARGRDRVICGRRENNLLISTYRQCLAREGRPVPPLRMEVVNDIPVGKGLGSSAAARLAGLALAVHFGRLNWSGDRIERTAAALEGHGDNTAACWRGGAVCCGAVGAEFPIVELGCPRWTLLLALPRAPLATELARAALPHRYSRQDAVSNVQAAMQLAAALITGDNSHLAGAMADRLHEPYRAALCPLLGALKPLAEAGPGAAISGVALSGAGPSVLLVVRRPSRLATARRRAQDALRRAGLDAELITTRIVAGGARASWDARQRPAVKGAR
jgi:homoserine kinase